MIDPTFETWREQEVAVEVQRPERVEVKMPPMPARLASYGAPDRRKRFLGTAMWQYLAIRVTKGQS